MGCWPISSPSELVWSSNVEDGFGSRALVSIVGFPLFLGALTIAAVAAAGLGLSERLVGYVLVFDLLLLGSCAVLGAATVTAAKRVPPPRRSGPRLALNSTGSRAFRQAARYLTPVFFFLPVPYWLSNRDGGVVSLVGYGVIVALWIRWLLLRAADRLEPRNVLDMPDTFVVLYVRPFDEERRLFAPGKTLEDFLSKHIKAVGELVALGFPGDRIPPRGALRSYYPDEEWRDAFDRLALSAGCIIGVVGLSGSTVWELGRIAELGVKRRLFLFTRPAAGGASDADAGIARRFVSRVQWVMELGPSADYFAKRFSSWPTPISAQPISKTPWADFSQALNSSGYNVEVDDPGPGTVLGFDDTGRMHVLATGAHTPRDYVLALSWALERD